MAKKEKRLGRPPKFEMPEQSKDSARKKSLT